MGGDHMCPVCSATFTRPQHVARHMRSHTGDRPYGCQMCGDRFARSDLLSRHVNKCHTPGGLANTTGRKGQSRAQTAADDKRRRPCEACNLQNTKCDFGKPCNNCTVRGSKCAYAKAKRARRDTNPSPPAQPTSLPPSNPQDSLPMHSFGGYQDDVPFNFNYPAQDSSLPMPHLFEPGLSVPGASSSAFIGSPEAPSLSFSATTNDSAESTPWNGFDFMGMQSGVPGNGFDTSTMFQDPNAPSFSSAHKLHSQGTHPFTYGLEQPQVDPQQPLTTLHQRSASAMQRHPPIQHHQRHRSTPSLDGPHPLLNSTLLRAQAHQFPGISSDRLYTHRGSISTSDSSTEYDSSTGRPGTAGEYPDYPSPMSLTGSDTGSVGPGVNHALDDMSLHDPAGNNLLSMGSMIVPGIGMGTGLTPAAESPSRPSMTQRQSTFGDLKAFWNECMDGQSNVGSAHGNENRHSLTKMTSMPCLKTPMGEVDITPRATTQDPLARLGQRRDGSSVQTPRGASHADARGLEQYQHAVQARKPPSLQIAPKMKAAAAKQEDIGSNNKRESSFATPFPPGSAQADAWCSLMSGASGSNHVSGGSYVADSNRPNYKRLPSHTLGPENSKRPHHERNDGESAIYTDDEEEEEYKQAQQEWHRRMSLPVEIGRSNGRLYRSVPSPQRG
ncbi:hypothetical protein FRC06_000629 [Ceratobasidium sp. 370]|nr:hypothetical protein FRC06_000629 [Ceratobasidium sp. 370]